MTEDEAINNLACMKEEIKDNQNIYAKETRYKTIDLAIAALKEKCEESASFKPVEGKFYYGQQLYINKGN